MSKKVIDSVDVDRLLAIAEKWGTPTYVYVEDMIRDRCRKLVNLFPGLPVSWLYAVKANDNPFLLEIISDEQLGFDTVSYEEVLLCRKLGVPAENIFYTENNMTDEEMHGAAREGVVLNFGSLGRLRSYCEQYPGSTCCVRIKPDISDGHHAKVDTGNEDSKFGIRMDLLAEAVALARQHDVSITGIHAHIGSGITEPENLLNEIDILLHAAKDVHSLKFINFGGGLPIPYHEGEEEFALDQFASLAKERFETFLEESGRDISFLFEPGRWIVGPAGVLLARVNTVKDQGRKKFLGTDTGFNHLLRPALYDSWHEIVNINAAETEKEEKYNVAGNICESGDILGTDRIMPETRTGDCLAILDAGAYGMTMASHYNRRALPAEILITTKGYHKMIRRRSSAQQTVDRFLKETGYTVDKE